MQLIFTIIQELQGPSVNLTLTGYNVTVSETTRIRFTVSSSTNLKPLNVTKVNERVLANNKVFKVTYVNIHVHQTSKNGNSSGSPFKLEGHNLVFVIVGVVILVLGVIAGCWFGYRAYYGRERDSQVNVRNVSMGFEVQLSPVSSKTSTKTFGFR